MNSLPARPTYCVIDLAAIQHNYRRMKEMANTMVMAVVKANAYGHGALAVAQAATAAGADWLGVAVANEGLELRRAGVTANILVLGYTSPNLASEAIENDLSLTVYDLEVARSYAATARALNKWARVQVKVDTGMSRLGVAWAEAATLVKTVELMAGVRVEGLFTHFATADEADQTFAWEQLNRFRQVVATAGESKLIHAANSAAALTLPEARFDLVRMGIALYGLSPSADARVPPDFVPALKWKSTVSQVKTLPPGTRVSYGGEYVTQGSETIAVIPVGYGDGFRRTPKNVAQVLVGGQRVPVVGRVCMDQIMANVSEVASVKLGDEVVLIGDQGAAQITAEEAATWWGTINYDVVTGIMARVPRVYLESNVS